VRRNVVPKISLKKKEEMEYIKEELNKNGK